MKLLKKILLGIAALLLTVVLVLLIMVFWHFPRYLTHKEPVQYAAETTPGRIRAMSYNVRYLNPFDFGEKSWFFRAELVMDCIEESEPTIVGFQEVTQWHYSYLKETLPEFDSIITYRDDSLFAEGCPIFYRTDLYELIDKGSFWLSETPEVMSKDWGSSHYRVCSYVILRDKATALEFVVFNAHLDHVSDEARIKGIQVVLDKISQFGDRPAILMGDLNATEDSATYQSAMETFLDTKYETENTMTGCTYHSWGEELDRDCIDYVLVSPDSFSVNYYKVLTKTYNGVYTSDHFPLLVELDLNFVQD